MNTRKLIIAGSIIVALFILYRFFAGTYNKLVNYEETVSTQWSKVQSDYQRRSDLIPNLVNTVKGYADFEKSTLTDVIEARSKATQVTVDPSKLSQEEITKFQQSQSQLSSALGRLMVVVEKYPELKANQNFLELQSQLEGTENRITVARNNFNDAAKTYNTYLRSFPNNLLGGMYGFNRKGYFEAAAGAEKAPEVKF